MLVHAMTYVTRREPASAWVVTGSDYVDVPAVVELSILGCEAAMADVVVGTTLS